MKGKKRQTPARHPAADGITATAGTGARATGAPVTVTAYLALGANLGQPRETMRAAIMALHAHRDIAPIDPDQVAGLYRTRPVGGPTGQPDYVNTALGLDTSLSPHELLDVVLGIEASLGRKRRERWGPRVIDIDILLCGDTRCADARLTLPHPRMHERRFVLEPLTDIAAELVPPGWQESIARTARRWAAEQNPPEEITPIAPAGWWPQTQLHPAKTAGHANPPGGPV